MEWIAIGIFSILWFIAHYFIYRNDRRPLYPAIQVNLKPLEDKISEIPNKVLQSITNSVNTNKGALGELIGYIQLRSSYDRIVPLGNIVDFLAIRFPRDGEEGKLVFIDIKTGKHARLSKDQAAFKKMIEEKRIEFMKLSIKELKETDESEDRT